MGAFPQPSSKTELRRLASEALKIAMRKRKHKILHVIPEGETGALRDKKTGEIIEWNGRRSFKKLGKRKLMQKAENAKRYHWRMTRMG